jgi:hypothetical protein
MEWVKALEYGRHDRLLMPFSSTKDEEWEKVGEG